MNIPDDVIEAVTGIHPEGREYPDDVRKDFHAAAEWARKEALREAATILDERASLFGYETVWDQMAARLRALAEGVSDE